MIKYKTSGLGSKALNERARETANYYYKPKLKGKRCGKCSKNTIIEFKDSIHITWGSSSSLSCLLHSI